MRKRAVVSACVHSVPTPVTVRVKAAPCGPLSGEIEAIAVEGAAWTVKAKGKSVVPTVKMPVRSPSAASAPMVMFAVAVVAEFTVKEFTVILLPKATVVAFAPLAAKLVFTPVKTTLSVCPCCPEFGATEER